MSEPYVPFDKTMFVEFIQTFAGETVVNGIYVKGSSVVTTALMDDLAAELITWQDEQMQSLHHTSWQLTMLRIRDLTSQFSFVKEYTDGLPISGNHAAAASTPGNAALVVTFRTGLAGRSFRGRNYIGGLPLVMDDPNHFTDAFAAALQAAYATLPTVLDTLTLTHVVASRWINGVLRTTGAATPVTGYTVNDQVDSQRRRLAGRGD